MNSQFISLNKKKAKQIKEANISNNNYCYSIQINFKIQIN